MGFFNVGRIIGYFFNNLFRWLFWNKTGQKILLTIVIAIILVAFVMLGEVSAAEPENLGSYDELSYDFSSPNVGGSAGQGKLITISGYTTYFYELNPYNYYVLSNLNSESFRVFFCDDTSLNSRIYDFHNFIDDFTFSNPSHKYLAISCFSPYTSFKVFYNAYPFEVTPMRSSLISYSYGLYQPTYFDSSSSFRNQCTWFFPIKKGFSYRILNGGNQLNSSTKYSFSFLSSVDGFNTYYNAKAPNTYNSNYDSSIDCLQIVNYGGDFVAPDDGYLILPGVLSQDSSYKLFSSQSDTSITATNSSVNNNLNNVNSSINNVNDSITDSSISDNNDDYVLPESGVNDIAESGFANIFDKLRTAFTRESSGQGLVVQVPFTDKSFTISKNTVFGSANLGIVGTLINSFWYFLVSLWIVKDIAHKMNMIKSGNIELAQTSNIKEDLL